MTGNFDISFFAHERVTFLHNFRCGDNPLISKYNNMINVIVYMAAADIRHVEEFNQKLMRMCASPLVSNFWILPKYFV